ncbi:MAG: hypothetical protein ABMA26_10180 [Limisphaerales bacterium]
MFLSAQRTNSSLAGVLPAATAALLGAIAVPAGGADRAGADLNRRFTGTVRLFVETYCVSFHGKEQPKAQLDLSHYSTVAAVVRHHAHWALVLEKLKAKEMPPEEAKKHPTPKLREDAVAWIKAMRRHGAEKHAGDPGPVLSRHLLADVLGPVRIVLPVLDVRDGTRDEVCRVTWLT